jgi:hypothetical protein
MAKQMLEQRANNRAKTRPTDSERAESYENKQLWAGVTGYDVNLIK